MRKKTQDLIAKTYGQSWRDGDKAEELHPVACAMLDYAAQRPGLEWCNYATSNRPESVKAYQAESRHITAQWRDVIQAFREYYFADGTEADLLDAMPHAFSGRLSWENGRIKYCTGQYWPTEYRLAVSAVFRYATRSIEYRKKA